MIRLDSLGADPSGFTPEQQTLHSMFSSWYSLPPGYQYDPQSQTAYGPDGKVDDFATAQIRAAIAQERSYAANLAAQNGYKQRMNLTFQRQGQAWPYPDLGLPPGTPDAPVPDPAAARAQAAAQAQATAQAAQLFAQYSPKVADARANAAGWTAQGNAAAASAWSQYADALQAWLNSLAQAYNLS